MLGEMEQSTLMDGRKQVTGQMIDGKTLVYGIIGHPVAHSYSPAMQNAALIELGLNGVYVPFDATPMHVAEAVAGLRALGIAGANVTVPYKEIVKLYMDELAESADFYGVVNTVVNRQGRLIGHNTDGPGFIKALREDQGYDPACGSALLLGAGGAARAVAMALVQAGCPELGVVNRDRNRALSLAQMLHAKTGFTPWVLPWEAGVQELTDLAQQSTLVVNCTTLGMYGHEAGDWPLPDELPGPGQLAYDLVYNPTETPFMARATANGARVDNGLGMLLHQGALALELWTGLSAPVNIMRQALQRQAGD